MLEKIGLVIMLAAIGDFIEIKGLGRVILFLVGAALFLLA